MKIISSIFAGLLTLATIGCGDANNTTETNANSALQATLDSAAVTGRYLGKTYCAGQAFEEDQEHGITITNTKVTLSSTMKHLRNGQPCRKDLQGTIVDMKGRAISVNKMKWNLYGAGCSSNRPPEISPDALANVTITPQTGANSSTYKVDFQGFCIIAEKK